MQSAGRVMQDLGGGVIINIANVPVNDTAEAGLAAYHASMGGLIELTRAAARELEAHHVNVNAIISRYTYEEATTEGETAAPEGRNIKGQLDHLQKIVEAVLNLCGPEGASLCGEVIEVEKEPDGRG